MKKFIVESGKVLIDVTAWIILGLIFISAFVSLFTSPFLAFGIIIVGLLLHISIFYMIYLFIDTNETLHKILDNEKNTNN